MQILAPQNMPILALNSALQDISLIKATASPSQDTNLWEVHPLTDLSAVLIKSLAAAASDDGEHPINGYSSTDSFTIPTELNQQGQPDEDESLGNCTISQFEHRIVELPPKEAQTGWLDTTKAYNRVCVETYGAALGSGDTASYCLLRESGGKGLEASTVALHRMFARATEHVLQPSQEQEAARTFLVPGGIWPLLRRSWALQRDDVVAGRFDLAITSEGIKVYEVSTSTVVGQ